MTEIKKFVKNKNSANKIALINILSNVLLQGIAFFTTPIFTRMLGTEQYGLYSVFSSWVTIMTCVLGFGTGSTIGTGMYEFKEEYYQFRSGVLLFGSVLSIGVICLGLFFSPVISNILGYSFSILVILLITAFAHYIIAFFQKACVYEREATKNLFISVMLSLSTVALSIFLIYQNIFDEKYFGRVYGTAIPYILIASFVWVMLFYKAKTRLCKRYCKFAVVVGFPVVFHMLAQNILGQSDRVMMQMMGIPNSEIGIYSLFYTITMVLNTVLSTLNTSWCSFYYEDLYVQEWEKLNVKCRNYIELFTVLTAGFLLLSREVSYIMADQSYWSGINIIPILVFAVYFTFMYQFPVNFEFFHKKTNVVAIGTVSAAILNIILNSIMIPSWGMYGAAIATSISYGGLFIMHYVIVTHLKKYSYHLNVKIFLPSLIIVCFFTVIFYCLKNYWYIRWGGGISLGIFEIYRIYKRRTIF